MKKSMLFIFLIVMITISGCKAQSSTINREEVMINFSVYQMLPNMILENKQNTVKTGNMSDLADESPTFNQLLSVYNHIDKLFITLNDIIENAVDRHDIKTGVGYTYKQYEYFARKIQNGTQLSIHNTKTDRNLQINVTTLANGDIQYSGSHKIKYDTFTYKLIDGKQMTIHLDQSNVQKKAFAEITKDNNVVKTHIIYEHNQENYEIYVVSQDNESAIMYLDNKQDDVFMNHLFEVVKNNGDILYESYDIDNGNNQATGWLLNGLNTPNILKISDSEYLVNENEFYILPNEVNLYQVNANKIINNEQQTSDYRYILGKLTYNPQLIPIIIPRAPFNTNYYGRVTNLATSLLSYYQDVNSK